jgi:hypothetical protein
MYVTIIVAVKRSLADGARAKFSNLLVLIYAARNVLPPPLRVRWPLLWPETFVGERRSALQKPGCAQELHLLGCMRMACRFSR